MQEKYERELVQHAQDIQAMAALKEEVSIFLCFGGLLFLSQLF